ncbi:MAG: S-methyl-5-thioribose-1-phosphate isomerase [Planctomycetota bacterium]|jgi:methylthioribose-1-phosphate isomerase|nr:S-methyl-5-thioribose-1-phosphate isomerase [Planctomycetota bacterium]MDP7251949.1 S-methyl-5-thioribose-1-phosphate isomerase [Planctomycetota bacterium]
MPATIEWVGGIDGHVRMIDQTKLPIELVYIGCKSIEEVWDAIKQLKVRGAPAIGIAAGMGVVVGIQNSTAEDFETFEKELHQASDYLATSRPTAVNLFWALERMKGVAAASPESPIAKIKERLLREAIEILEEDKKLCRRIGEAGAALLTDGQGVLTHCNAGGLATGEYGTALAVIFMAHEQGKNLKVYADETRPLLQGARLTSWELMQAGIDCTLICDSAAAEVMKEGRVQAVVVGADRIAANGDAANKIGTYMLSILAKEHDIPFYVAAPHSTFDLDLASGDDIPIEERASEEITEGFGRRTAPEGVKTYSPAFDVTPAKYIKAIITDRGVLYPPFDEKIQSVIGDKETRG